MVGGDRMAERKRKGEWLVPESFDKTSGLEA